MSKRQQLEILAAALFLTSCDTRTPVWSDEEVDSLRKNFPTMTQECVENARFEGLGAIDGPVGDCFEMQASKGWKGLWLDEFEGSTFCPHPATECEFPEEKSGVILGFKSGKRPDGVAEFGDGTVYEIEFIGRRTVKPDSHGRNGGWDHVIVVDTVVSIQPQVLSN